MSAAVTQQHPPAIPPRPARGHPEKDKDEAPAMSMPKVPSRPIRRAVSPNPDRFAPSPLNDKNAKLTTAAQPSPSGIGSFYEPAEDPIDRSGSVVMPSVGEEGQEYEAVTGELQAENQSSYSPSSSPEQTRSVGDDVALHAPKPSLPASSARQRVMAVTRTDSDRAAAFGIGRPRLTGGDKDGNGKTSSSSQTSGHESHGEEEQGIPEIGQQVPMLPNAGDVQAPSPAPLSTPIDGLQQASTARKTDSRGLPPGSYGLHGHGVMSRDRLDKAYYEKYPEKYLEEHAVPVHDRPHNFAMSSEDLNKLVRETASRGSGVATSESPGTPSDEIAFQASDQYTSRHGHNHGPSALSKEVKSPGISVSSPDEAEVYHVNDVRDRTSGGNGIQGDNSDNAGHTSSAYDTPILAADEIGKGAPPYEMHAAVEPGPERKGSSFEMEEPKSPVVSRPASIHTSTSIPEPSPEREQEYEPLFTDDIPAKSTPKKLSLDDGQFHRQQSFPSKDVWEDAPPSAHYTAEVSTPDIQEQPKAVSPPQMPQTPVQAFARQQELLAEEESRNGPDSFLLTRESRRHLDPPIVSEKPKQIHFHPGQRFPSRDIWEDAPDSHLHHTTVSRPQLEQDLSPDGKPAVPLKPVKRLPEPAGGRPKPKSFSSDDQLQSKPTITGKPKPAIPARPGARPATATSHSDNKESNTASSSVTTKAKPPPPPVPSRPAANKIAALQAGFLSDLNKRLQLGPQAPKKEEQQQVTDEVGEEPQEKAPLHDVRKQRARGPQRKAPSKSPAPASLGAAAAAASKEAETSESQAPTVTLTISAPMVTWCIDPEDGVLSTEWRPKTQPVSTSSSSEADVEVEDGGSSANDKIELPTEEESEKAISREAEADKIGETETLATNMAGEAVIEATVQKDSDNKIEPVEVEEVVKS